jgi:long-chain fatty acid transport protein
VLSELATTLNKTKWWGWLVGCLVYGITSGVHAFDTNYQDYLLGHRAAGMGGAFTAIANDPSAGYYNPAGYVGFERLKVGVNLTVYGFEYRNGIGALARDAGGVSLERLEFVLFPSTAGVASQFGGKDKKGRSVWGGGISFFVPTRTQIRFRTGFSETLNTRRRSAIVTLQRDGQSFVAGPSIARRFGPVSVGISAYYTHRFFSWQTANHLSLAECKVGALQDCETIQTNGTTSSVEGWSGGLNFRLGVLWKINKRLQLGLMASFSSIRLWGEGSFLSHQSSLDTDPKTKNPSKPIVQAEKLEVQSPLPFEFRLGLAYRPRKNLLLALDLSFFAPMKYALLGTQDILNLFQYPREVQRNPIVNTHIGLEWHIKPNIPFRFGLFTNLSSAPNIPEMAKEAYLSQVNMFGATTSIGAGFGSASIDFGISVSYGEGDFQRLRPEDSFTYERVPLRHLYIYMYLSGATEFIGYGIQQLLTQVKPLIRSAIPLPKPPATKPSPPPTKRKPPAK